MRTPQVVAIHVAPAGGAPMAAVEHANVIAGRGIEGDRYGESTGTFSKKAKAYQQVSLIEMEAIEAVRRDLGIALDIGEARRNITTVGVALNHLIGCEFDVGTVRLRGVRLCEPCGYLENLLTREGLREALLHRGGLRCEVLTSGAIAVGDRVSEGTPTTAA